ncbi:M16 family metallopeptidase [Hydrogenovibrio kuenenii]|uniref:M16 family metallopeptidase n=1 Tax=Hydrogenovibrio kuenenii TaxID=63658 RepID=UPI0004666B02|nr:pitrilysin family protein [Hydrogenovibrio kuenenii]
MKRLNQIVLLCFAFIFVLPAEAAVNIQHWTTSKGVRVYFVQANQLPMVDVELKFDAGSARDGSQYGAAFMTSDLLGTATNQLDENAISAGFNNIGAQFGSDAGRDSASLRLRTLTRPKILDKALSLFTQVVSDPVFKPEILDRERNQLLLSLKQKAVTPSALLSDKLWSELYGNDPYGHPVEGSAKTIQALTVTSLQAFYRQYYVAHNAQITIVGKVSRKQAEQIATQLTKALPEGQKPAPLPKPSSLKQAKIIQIPFKATQTHYALAQVGIERGNPDYAALFVGNQILGGSGFSSLLMENVREKRGLVYGVYSYFVPMRVAGPFMISLSTKNANEKVADKVVRQTLDQFMKGFSEKKLQAIKNNLIDGFPLRVDSNSKILAYTSMIGFYGLPLDYLQSFPKALGKVSKQDILDAWHKHIHPSKMLKIIVGQPSA